MQHQSTESKDDANKSMTIQSQ